MPDSESHKASDNPNITLEGKTTNSRETIEQGNYPPHNRDYYHMPWEKMREHGVLWYINRLAFHPRGISLTLTKDNEGNIIAWGLIGDGSEPFAFDPDDDDEEFHKFDKFLHEYMCGVRPEGEW
jgi:hypothetical protein